MTSCGGFFSGERFKNHEVDHQFGGHFHIFYCVGGHFNGNFLGFFKRSPLKNPPLNPEMAIYMHSLSFGGILGIQCIFWTADKIGAISLCLGRGATLLSSNPTDVRTARRGVNPVSEGRGSGVDTKVVQ